MSTQTPADPRSGDVPSDAVAAREAARARSWVSFGRGPGPWIALPILGAYGAMCVWAHSTVPTIGWLRYAGWWLLLVAWALDMLTVARARRDDFRRAVYGHDGLAVSLSVSAAAVLLSHSTTALLGAVAVAWSVFAAVSTVVRATSLRRSAAVAPAVGREPRASSSR